MMTCFIGLIGTKHAPPLPLIINYMDKNRDTSAKDEEAILFALQERGRVRLIGLATNLSKLFTAVNGKFPILERLFIWYT
jgi:hypothetical protein